MLVDLENFVSLYALPFILIILLASLLCFLGNKDGDDPAKLDKSDARETKPKSEPRLSDVVGGQVSDISSTSPLNRQKLALEFKQPELVEPVTAPHISEIQAEPILAAPSVESLSADLSVKAAVELVVAEPSVAESILPTLIWELPEEVAPVILVVDDSAVVRIKLSKLFQAAGFQVHLACDGVEALELLAKLPIELVLTDLEMPNMDGIELIAAIQASSATENLPIVAISGNDELQTRVQDIQGLYGIFSKPWNDRLLVKRLEALVNLKKRA